jgi:hypothetical protein
MAFIAFDLDNTLAFAEHLVPFGEFLSVATLNNLCSQRMNAPLRISRRLATHLARAEQRFIAVVASRHHLVNTILRPNLDALMRPILAARRAGKVRGIAIYSNSPSSFCLHLVATLIERRYQTPGLFCDLVDAGDPIRKPDYERLVRGEPLKTYKVARAIFKRCGAHTPFGPQNIIFVDERPQRHAIEAQVADGLTYIQPTVYAPAVPTAQKKELMTLLVETLAAEGLLDDPEYLASPVFRCMKNLWNTKRWRAIASIGDLLEFAAESLDAVGAGSPFTDDTKALRQQLLRALGRH